MGVGDRRKTGNGSFDFKSVHCLLEDFDWCEMTRDFSVTC